LKEKLEKCEAEIETSKKMNALSNLPLQSFSTEPYVFPGLFAVLRHLTILIFPSYSCVCCFSPSISWICQAL